MSSLPKFLYHGTRADRLADILANSLVPRKESGASQWAHTVESRPDALYLTTAYPLHFAANASGSANMLIVEIDTNALDPGRLFADEDCLALCVYDEATEGMSAHERVHHYLQQSHLYPADFSLKRLGTCAHLGAIPRAALSRACIVPAQYREPLIFGGFDPVIAPLNYKYFGKEYEDSVRWLFGDADVCAVNPAMPRFPLEVRSLR